MTDQVESFSAMLRDALGERLSGTPETYVDMLADDAVMTFPFAAAGMPDAVHGKAAIAEHLATLAKSIAFDTITRPLVHQTSDPEVTILEFEGTGRGLATGEPYEQRYISVIRTRDGRIVDYRDYWNPLAILRAVKGKATIAPLEAMDHG